MSVTFSHTAEPVISGWFLECGCGQWVDAVEHASHDEAVAALNEGEANGCEDEDCRIYTPYISPRYVGVEPLSANFSNSNARHILSLLGVHDVDLFGSMSVDEFELALAIAVPSEGKPSQVTVSVGGERVTVEGSLSDYSAANFVDCGRDAGYDARAFATLREVVEQAKELHAEQMCWS